MGTERATAEPLARFATLRTRDRGEAEQVVSDVYVPHRLDAEAGMDARLNVARSGGITLGYLRYGTGIRLAVPPMSDTFHLNLTLTGSTMVQQGGAEVRTAPGRSGVMVSPDRPSTLAWSADAAQFAVKIERRALETQLSALLHEAVGRPLRFALEVDLETPEGTALLTAMQFTARQLEFQDGVDDLVNRQLESFFLTQVLLGVPNNYRHRLTATAGPVARFALDEAIEYIEAHPERPLGIAELAAVAGVPATELAAAFRAELGGTPEEYVRSVRLARARAELSGWDGPAPSLTAVARRWGFTDVHRFTAEFRAAYGHDPAGATGHRSAASAG